MGLSMRIRYMPIITITGIASYRIRTHFFPAGGTAIILRPATARREVRKWRGEGVPAMWTAWFTPSIIACLVLLLHDVDNPVTAAGSGHLHDRQTDRQTDIGHIDPRIRIPLSAILWYIAIAKLGGIAGVELPSAAFKAPFIP